MKVCQCQKYRRTSKNNSFGILFCLPCSLWTWILVSYSFIQEIHWKNKDQNLTNFSNSIMYFDVNFIYECRDLLSKISKNVLKIISLSIFQVLQCITVIGSPFFPLKFLFCIFIVTLELLKISTWWQRTN